MSKVLICCTHTEGSQLEWLAKALIDSGWSVEFMHKGSRGVTSAHCVIAVLSPRSAGDPWLVERAKTAAKRRRLVSVRLGGARPPRGLKSEQVIDLSEWPARGADRAMNNLLGSVHRVVSGKTRSPDEGGSSAWIVAAVIVALVIGGWLMLNRVGPVGTSERYPGASGEPAAASDAPSASAVQTVSSNPPAGRAESSEGAVASKPAPVVSDASRLGSQALAQLAAIVAGGDASIEDLRRTTLEALGLDANEPHARVADAALRGLVDGSWADAKRSLDEVPAESSDPEVARMAGALRAAMGLGPVPGSVGAAQSMLCNMANDATFARTYATLDPAQRLRLLGSGCVIERLHRSAALRAQLGMGADT